MLFPHRALSTGLRCPDAYIERLLSLPSLLTRLSSALALAVLILLLCHCSLLSSLPSAGLSASSSDAYAPLHLPPSSLLYAAFSDYSDVLLL